MNYKPIESVLIQHDFVLKERAKHVSNVIRKYEQISQQKPYIPKKATKKQIAEMREWGVKKT